MVPLLYCMKLTKTECDLRTTLRNSCFWESGQKHSKRPRATFPVLNRLKKNDCATKAKSGFMFLVFLAESPNKAWARSWVKSEKQYASIMIFYLTYPPGYFKFQDIFFCSKNPIPKENKKCIISLSKIVWQIRLTSTLAFYFYFSET